MAIRHRYFQLDFSCRSFELSSASFPIIFQFYSLIIKTTEILNFRVTSRGSRFQILCHKNQQSKIELLFVSL